MHRPKATVSSLRLSEQSLGEKTNKQTNKQKNQTNNQKLHCINSKRKFILLPQETRHGPRFMVSSEGLSPEIDMY